MNKKVLCIDDQTEVLDVLNDYLDTLGYTVITAQEGEEGLKKASEETPNLIILDIIMPKKDGYAVLRELKADFNLWDIPVIMLTTKKQMQDMCELEGAIHFLSKPFRLKELADVIEEIFPKEEISPKEV